MKEQTFNILKEDYQHILFPYAYNILGSVEDARDAVQDVLYNYLAAQIFGVAPETGKIYQISNMLDPEKLKNYHRLL